MHAFQAYCHDGHSVKGARTQLGHVHCELTNLINIRSLFNKLPAIAVIRQYPFHALSLQPLERIILSTLSDLSSSIFLWF